MGNQRLVSGLFSITKLLSTPVSGQTFSFSLSPGVLLPTFPNVYYNLCFIFLLHPPTRNRP